MDTMLKGILLGLCSVKTPIPSGLRFAHWIVAEVAATRSGGRARRVSPGRRLWDKYLVAHQTLETDAGIVAVQYVQPDEAAALG